MEKKKKTILYLGGFKLPDLNAAAHRVINNGKILRKAGYDVVYLGAGGDPGISFEKSRAEYYGFECWAYPVDYTRLYSIRYFKSVYEMHAAETAAVIAYNLPAAALFRLKQFCHSRGIKVFADCTEWYGVQGEHLIQSMIKGLDSFLRMRMIQPRLDGMIAISTYLKNYYEKKLPTIGIPTLVDLREPLWQELPEQPKSSGKLQLVFAGESERKKDGLMEIVDVVLHHTDQVILNIIGMTKDDFLKGHPEWKKELEPADCQVRFHGRLSHVQTVAFIKKADFSIFYREDNIVTRAGFPTKFVESISCGTPVITTNTSDLAQYLRDGENGFFFDIEEPRKSLAKILSTDPVQLKQMKQNVQRETFHIENYSRLSEWFSDVMKIGENQL